MSRSLLTVGANLDRAEQLYLTVLPTSKISISGVTITISMVGGGGVIGCGCGRGVEYTAK